MTGARFALWTFSPWRIANSYRSSQKKVRPNTKLVPHNKVKQPQFTATKELSTIFAKQPRVVFAPKYSGGICVLSHFDFHHSIILRLRELRLWKSANIMKPDSVRWNTNNVNNMHTKMKKRPKCGLRHYDDEARNYAIVFLPRKSLERLMRSPGCQNFSFVLIFSLGASSS